MKNDVCEKRMDEFLSLDKYERIPLKVTLHLLTCKRCRSQARHLTLAERYASEPIHVSITEKLENMEVEPVSMRWWILLGVVMMLLLATFGVFLNRLDHNSFAIIFNVIFGVLVTVYCTLFIGTNMDFFVKKIERIQTA